MATTMTPAQPTNPPPMSPPAGMPAAPTGGVNGPFPPELAGWNWGAFLLSWIWGIGNHVWLSLLIFVPFIGAVWPIVLGFKGNEWAWQHRHFPGGVEEFKAVQRSWTRWAVGITVLFLVLFVGFFAWAMLTGKTETSISTTVNGQTTNTRTKDGATTTSINGVPVSDTTSDLLELQSFLLDYHTKNGTYPGVLEKVDGLDQLFARVGVSSYSPSDDKQNYTLCHTALGAKQCVDKAGNPVTN